MCGLDSSANTFLLDAHLSSPEPALGGRTGYTEGPTLVLHSLTFLLNDSLMRAFLALPSFRAFMSSVSRWIIRVDKLVGLTAVGLLVSEFPD